VHSLAAVSSVDGILSPCADRCWLLAAGCWLLAGKEKTSSSPLNAFDHRNIYSMKYGLALQ
jgi:hypothetical protein